MFNVKNYITNGTVAREKIVFDIERQLIVRDNIKVLASNDMISESFFGKGVPFKKGKQYWDKKYLTELQCAVVAECFNEEYLYHLCDVVEHLKNTKKKKDLLKIGLGVATILIVAGIAVLVLAK